MSTACARTGVTATAAPKSAVANILAIGFIRPPSILGSKLRWLGAGRANSIFSSTHWKRWRYRQRRSELKFELKMAESAPGENADTCAGSQTSRKLVLGPIHARGILKDTQFAQQGTCKGIWNQ